MPEPARIASVAALSHEMFDFHEMGTLLLRDRYDDLVEPKEFDGNLGRFLAHKYARRLVSYGSGVEAVCIDGFQKTRLDDYIAKSHVVGGRRPGARLDYRMRRDEHGEWHAIDVTIDGVSQLGLEREDFKALLEQKDLATLEERVRDKAAEFEAAASAP